MLSRFRMKTSRPHRYINELEAEFFSLGTGKTERIYSKSWFSSTHAGRALAQFDHP